MRFPGDLEERQAGDASPCVTDENGMSNVKIQQTISRLLHVGGGRVTGHDKAASRPVELGAGCRGSRNFISAGRKRTASHS